MTATQPDSDGTATQAKSGLTRRGVMRKTAIGIGATATMGGGAMTLENGPVQESEAVAPIFVAGAIGAGIVARWAVDEVNAVLSDPPAEGLTPTVLEQQIAQTTRTRQSTNASSFVDNVNILDGVEHNAYTDAKIAAIEGLNAGSTETAVLNAAIDALDTYETTIKKNLLESWNESAREFYGMLSLLESHPDLVISDVFANEDFGSSNSFGTYEQRTTPITLPSGISFDIETIYYSNSVMGPGTSTAEWDPTQKNTTSNSDGATIMSEVWAHSPEPIRYMSHADWSSIWTSMNTIFQNVRDGISLWVTTVYSDVQSGSIEISDLVTPRERAAMMAEDESISTALADLIALNIPVDLEREATIHIAETGTTLRGSFALTNEADGPIESGATYDPATFAGDAYFTTDISLLEGTWSAFETAVDGGTVTLTAEPYEGMVYEISTTADETVSVPASDWIDSDTDTWTYDASASLETPITEVASVSYFAESDETQFETIGLDSEFTVERLENTTTGEDETSASFSATEPQDDTNYITQDEWDSLEQQNQELIEKYEESQNSGGGGGGLLGDSLGGDIQTLGIVAGGAALAALLFGNN